MAKTMQTEITENSVDGNLKSKILGKLDISKTLLLLMWVNSEGKNPSNTTSQNLLRYA